MCAGASRVAGICNRFPPMQFMTQDKTTHRRIGVWTTSEVKERARISLQTLLRTEHIVFGSKFTSQSIGMRELICEQLRKFRYHYKEPPDQFSQLKRVLTGKNGAGMNDDLVMVLMFLAYWSPMAMDDQRCLVALDEANFGAYKH